MATGLILIGVVVVLAGGLVWKLRSGIPQPPTAPRPPIHTGEAQSLPAKQPAGFEPATVHDLRQLPSVRLRIVGSAYQVTDRQRAIYAGHEYLLVREPKNRHDPNAVAAYGHGRKVGYISRARAEMLVPLLDRIGAAAYQVRGEGVSSSSIRIWAEVPTIPDLRRHARSASEGPK